MADVEKVIRGWERCKKGTCPTILSQEYKDCEYTDGLYCRKDRLIDETLELLKEQKEQIKRLKDKLFAFPDAWIHCKDCKFRHMDEHGIWFCENHDVYPEEEWFCADGERRK